MTNFRYHPAYLDLKRRVAAGECGAVLAVRTVFCSARRALPDWKQSAASGGGGALRDLGVHHLDLLPWLLGAPIKAVSMTERSRLTEADTALLHDNIYARTSQSLVDYLYGYYGASRGEAPFFTSNNMAAPRSAFLALGGFDQTFPLAAAEDREFGMRWRERIGPLRFVPDAVIGHAHPLTLRRFCRQHANYGRGARHLARVAQANGAARHKVEPAGFYLRLMSHPLIQRRSFASVAESGLMLLSQLAMTWGYADEWRKDKFYSGQQRASLT